MANPVLIKSLPKIHPLSKAAILKNEKISPWFWFSGWLQKMFTSGKKRLQQGIRLAEREKRNKTISGLRFFYAHFSRAGLPSETPVN